MALMKEVTECKEVKQQTERPFISEKSNTTMTIQQS